MRRGYKIADYVEKIEAIKSARREISVTSDIIVGFPGETEEEFEDTLRLVEQCQYDSLYIFKYSERPGTPASKLPETVSEEEKTRRFIELERLQMSLQRPLFEAYVGSEVKVLAERVSAKSSKDLTGHTTCHKVVNFEGAADLLGKIVPVRVKQAKEHSLYGEVAN
jgi:tRNA-2-methylthio-N6-dimethylallyladenosine synthase